MPTKGVAMETYAGTAAELLGELAGGRGRYLYLPNAESVSPRLRRRAGGSLKVPMALIEELVGQGYLRRDRCAWLVTPAGRAAGYGA